MVRTNEFTTHGYPNTEFIGAAHVARWAGPYTVAAPSPLPPETWRTCPSTVSAAEANTWRSLPQGELSPSFFLLPPRAEEVDKDADGHVRGPGEVDGHERNVHRRVANPTMAYLNLVLYTF